MRYRVVDHINIGHSNHERRRHVTDLEHVNIYSPSQTKLWMECPYKWYLSRVAKYESRYIEKRHLAALVGQSYGLGMAHYFRSGRTLNVDQVVDIVQNNWDHELSTARQTRELQADDLAIKYPGYFRKMIERTLASEEFIPESWEVSAVEELVGGDTHKAYIDLGGKDNAGRDYFWDFKCKMYCVTRSVPFKLAEYEYDWQMLHYAWAYSETIGRFVDTYYIGMMVVQPTTRLYVRAFYVTPEVVTQWLTSAVTHWKAMTLAEERLKDPDTDPLEVAPMTNEHHKFGKCSHFGLCFHEGADNFIQIERT